METIAQLASFQLAGSICLLSSLHLSQNLQLIQVTFVFLLYLICCAALRYEILGQTFVKTWISKILWNTLRTVSYCFSRHVFCRHLFILETIWNYPHLSLYPRTWKDSILEQMVHNRGKVSYPWYELRLLSNNPFKSYCRKYQKWREKKPF